MAFLFVSYRLKLMIINRIWAMPNKWTFKIYPIKNLLNRISDNYSNWVDPFAGMNSPCGFTNDIRSNMNAKSNLDAQQFLKGLESNSFDGCLYDPPYSLHQAKQCYESAGLKNLSGSMKWWAVNKDEIARVIKPGGLCVSFGWNSNGLGKNRGFEIIEILVVPHGGSKNDTIVVVEKKL